MRTFKTGATRDSLGDKLQYSRFLSPAVIKRYCEYLQKHREQADGNIREPDNWKHGIDEGVYMDSLLRHVIDLRYGEHYGIDAAQEEEELLCAIMFNAMGMLFEKIKLKGFLTDKVVIDRQDKIIKSLYEALCGLYNHTKNNHVIHGLNCAAQSILERTEKHFNNEEVIKWDRESISL